ncbi:hypothetical protein SAMN05428965_0545 [Geodermatophilus sp. DSM 45219]|nr:hypothetical protein SAMN05428965_0545 [Geodermatophilus sp. DSM 45219]
MAGVGVGEFRRAHPGCLRRPGSNGQLPSTTDAWARRGNPCAEAAAKAVGPPTPSAHPILAARSGPPRHQLVRPKAAQSGTRSARSSSQGDPGDPPLLASRSAILAQKERATGRARRRAVSALWTFDPAPSTARADRLDGLRPVHLGRGPRQAGRHRHVSPPLRAGLIGYPPGRCGPVPTGRLHGEHGRCPGAAHSGTRGDEGGASPGAPRSHRSPCACGPRTGSVQANASAGDCPRAPRPGHDGLLGQLRLAGPGPLPARGLSGFPVQHCSGSSLHREPGCDQQGGVEGTMAAVVGQALGHSAGSRRNLHATGRTDAQTRRRVVGADT